MTQSSLPLAAVARPRLPWALVPVALLLSSALGVGSMAVIAARDPHFATEPDYYQKAIHWDQTQAQAATNQRLGYTVEAPAAIAIDRQGRVTVEFGLNDQLGQQVRGGQLLGEAFANAYSAQIVRLAFAEQVPGRYRAKFSAQRPGLWIFRIAGSAAGEHFTADFRVDLTRTAGAP
ncbi:MAG TPA: FixH family protein [Polyangiaceae bacterium]|nr:FixH family protein [Polyangiaceae bacterium]